MERPQIQLGPFEVFSAAVGGIPTVAAGSLIYFPSVSAHDLFAQFIGASSLTSALLTLLLCYVAGVAMSGPSWRYFVHSCSLLSADYRYLRDGALDDVGGADDPIAEALVPMVTAKFGSPSTSSKLDGRVWAYMTEHGRMEVIKQAEVHQAMHIMARNLSVGFLFLAVALAINATTSSSWSFSTALAISGSLTIVFTTLMRAVSFKKWHNRGLLLGFYFAETEESK